MNIKSSAISILASCGIAFAQEDTTEITGLSKAAMDYVTAYNARDAKAISQLFTENGEMTDLFAEDVLSGRAEIRDHYEEVFAAETVPEMALDVVSVRIVAPNLAIEDGTAHFTPPGENEPPVDRLYCCPPEDRQRMEGGQHPLSCRRHRRRRPTC